MEIMRYARRRGLLITILTNATMLTPTLADQIRALEPYQVDVSVYGATARTYEAVTRVPGSFARFVSGVDLLNDRGVPVMLKLVLLTTNVHEHDAMRELASARQLPYQVSTDVHPRVDGSLEPLAYRLAPEQAFEVWRRESGRRLREDASDSPCGSPRLAPADEVEARCLAADGLFHCRCGTSSAAVTPHGKLNLCLSVYHPQYDLGGGSVQEGWRQLVDLVAAAKAGPDYECPACPLTQHCSRGVGDSWLQHGVFDSACVSYFRDLAERKADFLSGETPAPPFPTDRHEP